MHIEEHHAGAAESILFLHGGSVAGWMWTAQAEALPEYHAIVPDLPGFGASAGVPWTDLETVADDLAGIVRERGAGGRAHIVGLSLGGVLGALLCARHPDVVRRGLVTGAAVRGVGGLTRVSGLAQIALWGSAGYWRGLARAFRLPADAVPAFVETGLGTDRASARRMTRQVYDGLPAAALAGLGALTAPLLVLAGEREPRQVRDALPDVAGPAPRGTAAIVPRMHHVWSAEDPELFHRVLAHWLARAEPSPELLPLG
ncbi:alpha/beta fold hydrolase [Microbacterium sediminis]|uniref:AB hydrolase-1 domain-containing protein n=1 Tax=Microbacterium sediminis TaxID=904291 RepID=A0A1B9N9Q7_9MICO|nr:alpha/beta fold hydrolase [Microbacterium sediminis]OCG73274.1 hypothetical protein A7J15_08215 [Microbacterium sediminis]